MPDREQLYTALKNADAAGDTAGAQKLAAYIQTLPPEPEQAPTGGIAAEHPTDEPGAFTSTLAGLGKGFGSTVLSAQGYVGKALNGIDSALGNGKPTLSTVVTGAKPKGSIIGDAGQWLVNDAESGKRKLKAELTPYHDAHPIATGTGEVGGEIVATLPVGGVLGKGIQAVASLPKLAAAAPTITRLANSVASGGMKTGGALPQTGTFAAKALAQSKDLALRAAGGAITGGATAALADPEHAGSGAVIGAALPGALKVAGAGGAYAGKVAKSIVQPFTEAGQSQIAGNIVRRFADGGPTTLDLAAYVPGSLPTLGEASGNAGLAGLQRGVRDINPNPFVAREAENAAARNATFEGIAGTPEKLQALAAERAQASKPLYDAAFQADAMRRDLSRSAQQARAPFSGVGLSGAADDLATPGLRDLAQRPMFSQAVGDAKRLAANNGVKLDDPLQSLQGLHYTKLALDDALNPAAKSAMGRNASNAVMSMRDGLTDELAKVSPLYGNARQTFATMSKPINEMEALQALRLTDANGNMTLSKVKNGIEGLERQTAAPGISNADSITPENIAVLQGIHNDLRRQANSALGKSAGSNTFQNIATDNIISSFLPGAVGDFVKGKAGSVLGQVGKLAYSGPNEEIRSKLSNMMLEPALAQEALNPTLLANQSFVEKLLQNQKFQQPIYRTAPLLGGDQ